MRKLLIVDDHPVVREGLKKALESCNFTVVAMAHTIDQARALIAHTNPDVIIVDLNLPDGSGFDLVLWARSISRELAIIILTLNDEPAIVHAAKKAGANAFVLKSDPIEHLIAAVNHCVANPNSFTSTLSIPDSVILENPLTAREIDVVNLLAKGLSNKGIGETLFLSQSTIKSHLGAIFRKLEAGNRVTAVKKARDRGLVAE